MERPFANVSHNFRDGSTTVFAGPRAKGNPSGRGPNTTFKDGLYVTVDSTGRFTDVGGRIDTSSELTVSGAGKAFSGETMNFSFAGLSPVGSALFSGG